jgi:hypothetical protein
MRDLKLFIKLTIYYVVLFGGIWIAYQYVPDLHRHLPLGTVEYLLTVDDPTGLTGVEIHASKVTTEFHGIIWLITAILGSVILMVPVSWMYLAIRTRSKLDQSLLETIIILPIVVTSIVLLVHNSLALAFSLTGVVAGVRYRNALKSTADSLFIFSAVGVGLAAGIGHLMIAAIMTVIFNYVFLVLWSLNYGHIDEAIVYMRPSKAKIEDDQPVDPGYFE